MKKGLLGCVNNPSKNIDKIKVWATSFKEVSDGEICLVVINPTAEDINGLETLKINHRAFYTETTETINNVRLQYQINTLKELDWEWVIVTDVFDVMFQDDPFNKVIGDKDITIGSEGIYHNEEPWNLDVMQKSYPDKLNLVRNKLIYCSGVIGGNTKSIIELLTKMDNITMSGMKGHDIRDQAALNIILNEEPQWEINLLNPTDGWVLHCAAGGPTQFYEQWGFNKLYQERWGEAELVDWVVINGQGNPFDIIHQFNRIPLWNQKLTQRYV